MLTFIKICLNKSYQTIGWYSRQNCQFFADFNLTVLKMQVQTEFGWQEYWQFQPEQIDTITAERKFSEKIEQCIDARWYMLKQTVYTRGRKGWNKFQIYNYQQICCILWRYYYSLLFFFF